MVHFKIMQTPFMRQSMNLEGKQRKQIKIVQSQPQTCAPQGSASFNIQHIHVTEQQSAIFAYIYIKEMIERHLLLNNLMWNLALSFLCHVICTMGTELKKKTIRLLENY